MAGEPGMAANARIWTILRKLVEFGKRLDGFTSKNQMLNENGFLGRPSEVTSTQLIAPDDFD
jgi:hypothetical protein